MFIVFQLLFRYLLSLILRRKFADNPDFAIQTVRGLGYKATFTSEKPL